MRRVVVVLVALLLALAAPAGAAEPAAGAAKPRAGAAARGEPPPGDRCAHDRPETVRLVTGAARSATARAAGVVSAGSCPGVRPGGRIVVAGSAVCTLNFRFTGRDQAGTGHAYIGTAGHCAFGPEVRPPVQRVWAPGQGPVVTDAAGRRIGTFAYAIFTHQRDFGLIRLDAGVPSKAQMCHFGGPTGINHDRSSATTTLHYYGQGFLLGAIMPARTAVAQGMPDESHVRASGLATPGDSGAGVISADGRAVGLVVTLGVHGRQIGTSGVDVGTVGIVRLGPVLKRAAFALRERLTLHTAPRL